jgi:hypothetical protein
MVVGSLDEEIEGRNWRDRRVFGMKICSVSYCERREDQDGKDESGDSTIEED